ncbi:hypothetical protein BST14_27030 [Mycobacterium arosiense ATCC BAA-1401 = DSM 45069]|uniref:Acyl-protein synthetase LuxE domain-containing protein n=1 Tax=Mycobacterium arosiense ATCC BAA-1401 = DSM 45069 TaxID=1265311 RepID=A0A1W9Z5G6_MYCAI|nr:hypothetical protein BST14_27030 [Mycobacterium arosiense ATCC BAA-1401 = DSM 45069]
MGGIHADAVNMVEDPVNYFGGSLTRMHSMPWREVEVCQRDALQWRFDTLRDRVPILRHTAERQGIDRIDDLESVIPLLFDHTVFKSYPTSLIDNKRFDQLTRWLQKLTTHDLSDVDTSGCVGLDDWFDVLDRDTPLCIAHSSGTTGTLSLLPWDKQEWDTLGALHSALILQRFGQDEDCRTHDGIHVVYPFYRSGALGHLRNNDQVVKHISRGEQRFHAAYPGRLSSDVMYLAGRLRAAQASGRLDALRIDPSLLERKEAFDAQTALAGERIAAFFDGVLNELTGQRILILSTWNLIHKMAKDGLQRGMRNQFSEDSIVISGGGAKGMTPPQGWKDDVMAFVGNDRVRGGYSMSEVALAALGCEYDHHHVNPWIVPFVLDPASGAPLPRTGIQTGQAAFFDLLAQSHWGGFISGDQVTLSWAADCGCGRSSPYYFDTVCRLADQYAGDDDKITCAATAKAHGDALAYLNELEGSTTAWS